MNKIAKFMTDIFGIIIVAYAGWMVIKGFIQELCRIWGRILPLR